MKKILSFVFICLLVFLVIGCNTTSYSLFADEANSNVTLEVGDIKSITVVSEGGTLVWESSDNEVVTVDSGTVKGIKVGAATIKVSIKESPDTSIIINVTVKEKVIAVTGIALAGKKTEVEVEDTFTVTAVVTPTNATDKTVTWASSDPTVAKVENGKVTALKVGTTEISATAGDKTEKFTLKVNEKTPEVVEPAEIYLDHEKETMQIGETDQLTWGIDPEEASQEVEWIITPSDCAAVDSDGKLTALKGGTVTIKVCPKGYEDISDSYQLLIYDNIEGMTISGKNKMAVGGTQVLSVETLKKRADGTTINTISTYKWESTDPEILTINDKGLVTAVKAGTAEIKAIAEDSGAFEATFSITVTASKTYTADNQEELTAALEKLSDGDVLILGPGTYTDLTITQDGVTILGPNAGLDKATSVRLPEAEFTGTLKLQSGVKDFTLDGVAFVNKGSFNCVGKGSNITLKNLYVHDTDTVAWKEARDNAIPSTICFNHQDNDIDLKNITVSHCYFENLHMIGLYLARLLDVKVEYCTFHNFDQDAIRGDGGYNNGKWEFLNNKFYNDEQKGTNGIYLQSVSGNIVLQEIYILHNEFINIGDSSKESGYIGAFSCRTYQEEGMKFYFKYNLVQGCLNGLHVRNNGEKDLSKYVEEINYNAFIGVTGFYHRNFTTGSTDNNESNPVECNMDYNYFEDAQGNALTYDQIKNQLFEVKSCDHLFTSKEALDAAILDNDNNILLVGTFAGTTKEAYASIAAALEAAEDGNVIMVAAGTYADDLTINKSVKLLGPNAGILGNGTRATEAVISGAMSVSADGVVIDGFEISKQLTFPKNAEIYGFEYINNLLDKMDGEGYVNGTEAILHNVSVCGNYTPECSAVRWIRFGVIDGLKVNNNKIVGSNLYDAFRADVCLCGVVEIVGNHVENSLQSVTMFMGVGRMRLLMQDNYFKDILATCLDTRGMVTDYAGNVTEYVIHNTFDHAGYDWRCLRPRNASYGDWKLDVQAHYNSFINGSCTEVDGVKTYANNPAGNDIIFNMDNNFFQEVKAADLTVANFANVASSCANCYDSAEALEAAYNGLE